MLAPWRKAMTNLDSVLKSRDITLLAKGLSSQSYGFSSSQVWMWETIKKFKHWRIDAFKLWCWRRLLKVPWTARRPTQNIHWKDWCWSSNTLASWCEELTHRKDPDAGKDWRREKGSDTGWDGWMASLTWWTWVWVSSGSWWWTGKPGVLQSMGSQRVRHSWATELNW